MLFRSDFHARQFLSTTRVLRRSITARELVAALTRDGFALQRVRGSHRMYRHANGRRVVVAYHGLGETFPLGTLRAMIAGAGWSNSDLERLGLG